MSVRETTIYLAKLAEKAERVDDMAEAMKNVVKMGQELTADERILFTEAYEKKIYSRCASLRILASLRLEENVLINDERIRNYLKKVNSEVDDIRTEVVSLIDEHLIPSCNPGDHASKVFYLKMKGDFYRIQGEIWYDKQCSRELEKTYEDAMIMAHTHLSPTHPIRMGLDLNRSVYYHDNVGDYIKGIYIAKEALDAALSSSLGSSNEELCEDSKQIMRILEKNFKLWKS